MLQSLTAGSAAFVFTHFLPTKSSYELHLPDEILGKGFMTVPNTINEDEIPSEENSVVISIQADSTLGYASIQNDVPVVRSILITNGTSISICDLEILISCSPAFAQGTRFRFDSLNPQETRRLSPVDLIPEHTYLSQLDEAERATIRVSAISRGETLAENFTRIDILAYDQWAGTRSLPELLAAFAMPNAPVVDQMIAKASRLLRSTDASLSMDAYQSKHRNNVWKQVSAIYSILAAENIQYTEPPASFSNDGQRIRTPERIFSGRVATCLDLTMLFVSCLEQVGLNAVVLFKEGHAWVGVWLIPTSFGTPVVDDIRSIRKRVDSGELIVFETTGIALQQKPSLRSASERGKDHLSEENVFRYAIDIKRARELCIRPLPSREQSSPTGTAIKEIFSEPLIESPPELPPLDPELLPVLDKELPLETPDGRLAQWKAKLLDLTLRNRLINFKPTKSNIQLLAPNPGAIEDKLSERCEFKLRPLPELMEGSDFRETQVHQNRTGNKPLEAIALEALSRNELITHIEPDKLDGRLLSIFTAAQTGIQEGGANTLFLAIGFLRWMEEDHAEASHLAPILLIPVTLQRQSVRSGFTLSRHDDETVVNPTLVQKLARDEKIKLPTFDSLPTDEKGVDVTRILQTFRLAVSEIKGWEVLEQVHLGIFSFTKYLMWKDLQARTEQLKQNRVVAHLINHPGESFSNERQMNDDRSLDERYRPQDIFTPMLADSSQLSAICAVAEGKDLVLEGPPGTGKSQTITNLIAHFLATGKSVLFVSEKMAALEVVHRRLSDIALGPFCLELHSAKANKVDVLQQLGQSLDYKGAKTSSEWEREAERLAVLRQELNGIVQALHREHRNGLTVYQATGIAIQYGRWKPASMPWINLETHDRQELDALREMVRQIEALAATISDLQSHSLSHIKRDEWSPSWQDELLDAASALETALHCLESTSRPFLKLLGLPKKGQSLQDFMALDRLADVLLESPNVPVGLAKSAHDGLIRGKIETLKKHGMKRQKQWELLDGDYKEDLANLNANELEVLWSQADVSWWLKSWFIRRSVTSRLALYRKSQKRPQYNDVQQIIPMLRTLNIEDLVINSMHADAEALLGESFAGVKTDWALLDKHEKWLNLFSEVVIQIGGRDTSTVENLRVTLESLVTENRTMLLSSGEVGQTLGTFRDALRQVRDALIHVEKLAQNEGSFSGEGDISGFLPRLLGILQDWKHSSHLINAWCSWRRIRTQAMDRGLQGVVASLESGAVSLNDIVDFFEYSYQSWWLKKTIDSDPLLRGFSTADHQRKIREFRETDKRFQELTQQYIVAKLAGNIPSSTAFLPTADSETGRLRREITKQRRHMPIRQLVQALPTLLPKLKPCLLMSPLSVAQYLETGHHIFDLVVFDEASQIPVWDAVGAIARGKQLVVVGDPKQLPPTNFFNRTDDDTEPEVVEDSVKDLESILDECLGAGLYTLSLNWHYRSRHESLITFSNINYYGSRLITFPSPVTEDIAVRFERVSGVYDRGGSRTNRAEAAAIVEGIEKHFLDPRNNKKSLGIVTFNQTQKSLIDTMLDARRRENPVLDRAIAQTKHEPLFIKNLENVQGDERDVIYFSITYGADASGKMSMNFGPLNNDGGHRRLNVAVSRAREKVVIFSSLLPEQIDLSRVRAKGVQDLKSYLEFAIRGPRALLEQSFPTGREPDSPFEESVIRALREKGWIIHSQVGCSGYRIDMAVVDPCAPGRYLLGIECDGRTYHSGATARDRDRLRQMILEGLGWQLHRIWSTDWWINPKGETIKMQVLLDRLVAETSAKEGSVSEEETKNGERPTHIETQSEIQPEPEVSTPTSPHILREEINPLLQEYFPVVLSSGVSEKFYELESSTTLRNQLVRVIEADGPISDRILFRRVARAWGLERTGSKIVERLRSLIPQDIKTTKERDVIFYWATQMKPSSWRGFRVSGESEESRRSAAELCIEEIANIADYIIKQSGSLPILDLARATCRLIGMGRTPADVEEQIKLAIRILINTKRAELIDDRVRPRHEEL